MAGVAVSTQVSFRNNMGVFIADCENAARETITDLVTEGAALSKSLAPKGHKPDPRTQTISASIEPVVISRTSGLWRATARHAMAQERGASAHTITGRPWLGFYWEAEGRDWEPGLMGKPDRVSHPGNPAHPYLKPAYEVIFRRAIRTADQYYPD